MIIPISFTHYLKLFNSIFYMIRTPSTHSAHSATAPFQDIINQPNDIINEEPQKDPIRKGESHHQNTDSSKENHSSEDDLP
jgi:hypothetical protein